MAATATEGREHVLQIAGERRVRYIRLWFTDILGFLKSFAIPISQLERALDRGIGFDGSSIEGFARIDESDMIAMPDPRTFQILPWPSESGSVVGCMFCDIRQPDGSPYEGDPRWVLKKNLQAAAELGYDFFVGPELEYFYFKNSHGTPQVLDRGGYFDLTPLDVASELRKKTVDALGLMDIPVEMSHHEVACSQHEIDLEFAQALTMADRAMTYRLVVKEVALREGLYATFMPKPIYGQNGSGMHVHQSLFRDGQNAMFDADDPYYLSPTAKHYIAGLLKHAREITLVTNQWVNSYKRLVPGYEAPVYVTWARKNRSDLVRVPDYYPGREQATRVEYRSPDPACNPYLAFALMLAAGLEGIKRGYDLPDPVQRNVYRMTDEERVQAGIETLPADLSEAIYVTSKSQMVREALGEHVFSKLIENKRIEWEQYRAQVTSYEIEQYLPIL